MTTELSTDPLNEAIERAKRAFALKKYEQSVEHYATALELQTQKYGDRAPGTADLYFSYGKALLENAIAQSSVLGKEQQPEDGDVEDKKDVNRGGGPILSFSGDGDEMNGDDDDEGGVDLFAQAAHDIAEADAAGERDEDEEDEDEDAEPEDDFNAAWEVLDLARAIYDRQKEEEGDDEVALKLADTYIALGDVSLETEKFDQAIMDYEAGIALKVDLLPISSRQIAEAHYKLSMVLDLTPGRLSDAIVHAEQALASVESRLAELRDGLSNEAAPPPAVAPSSSAEQKPDTKGKGKATGTGAKLRRDDLVQNMTRSQIESEIKELAELKEDLALKVEELKTTPSESTETSAPVLAAQALDKELNGRPSSIPGPPQLVVNDLTSIVKKKKKPIADNHSPGTSKRKADEEAEVSPKEKKAKLENAES